MDEAEVLNHWQYFLVLEKDIIRLKDYIAIHQDNYGAYSFELSKLLQLACAEIDSVCRVLCKIIDPNTDYFDESTYSGKISLYKSRILDTYPKLTKSEIHIPGFSIKLIPWEDWENKDSPKWWEEYNLVKHYRHSCFKKANLKNTLFSMSALMVLILYLYRTVVAKPGATPSPGPEFFFGDYCVRILTTPITKELPDFDKKNHKKIQSILKSVRLIVVLLTSKRKIQ